MKVCLAASTLAYSSGGYFWLYLNWALGLQALGCDVIWLEQRHSDGTEREVLGGAETVHRLLGTNGAAAQLALTPDLPASWVKKLSFAPLSLDDAVEADLLLSLDKLLPEAVVQRFGRSALIDIDPGITQGRIKQGQYVLPEYDVFFTIADGVPRGDAGIDWQYAPPCIALDRWPPMQPSSGAAFTTVTHWRGRKWFSEGEETYRNDKRSGFAPYRDLPKWTSQPLELAIPMSLDDWPEEYEELRALGWRLRDSVELSEPSAYQEYVQGSLGEFSCAKPAYSRLGVAWISDRTLCYLASGKPAVVQHTGPSSVLPDAGSLFRFRDLAEAASQLDAAVANYEESCRLARALAEEHFDARKVVSRVLELSV